MQWIKNLKIAIIEEDENKIDNLIQQLPQFNSLEQMQEAAHLMQEAYKLLKLKKDHAAASLLKIKKQKEFLQTTSTAKTSFDQSH